MNKNNNSTSKMVDEKNSCDSSIKDKLLRTFNTVNDEINSSNVKMTNGYEIIISNVPISSAQAYDTESLWNFPNCSEVSMKNI